MLALLPFAARRFAFRLCRRRRRHPRCRRRSLFSSLKPRFALSRARRPPRRNASDVTRRAMPRSHARARPPAQEAATANLRAAAAAAAIAVRSARSDSAPLHVAAAASELRTARFNGGGNGGGGAHDDSR